MINADPLPAAKLLHTDADHPNAKTKEKEKEKEKDPHQHSYVSSVRIPSPLNTPTPFLRPPFQTIQPAQKTKK
jgi:hypothetical protein